MVRRRGLLMVVGAVALVCVSAVVTYEYLRHRMPDPATADRDGLFRWLVVRDMAVESPAIRAALVARLEHELDSGLEVKQTVGKRLDPGQQRCVWRNAEILIEDWFRQQSVRYFELPPAQRPAEIDRQIDRVQRWGIIEPILEYESTTASSAGGSELSRMTRVMAKIQTWIDRTPPDQRAAFQRFMLSVQGRLLFRALWSAQTRPA